MARNGESGERPLPAERAAANAPSSSATASVPVTSARAAVAVRPARVNIMEIPASIASEARWTEQATCRNTSPRPRGTGRVARPEG